MKQTISITTSDAKVPTLVQEKFSWAVGALAVVPDAISAVEDNGGAVPCYELDNITPQVKIFADSSATGVITFVTDPYSVMFQNLLMRWREERGATSSTTEIVMCDAYQKIIGMGDKALPLILTQLESEGDDPDQWFWALQAITGANPVAEEDEGDYRLMTRAWMHWAEQQDYLR